MTDEPRRDPLPDDISRSIADRVDRLPAGSVTVHDVRQRARRIRRNRRLAAGAAVAVVVPSAMWALPRGDGGGPSPAPPMASSSPSPSPPATDGPAATVLPAEPERGDGPAIAWMEGSTLHEPGGAERELGRSYRQFVQVGELLFGAYTDDGTVLEVLDGTEVTESLAVNGAPVVSSDGTMAAWAEPDGSVTVASEDDTTDLGVLPGTVVPVAVTGDPRCDLVESQSCVVYANQGEDGAGLIGSNGAVGPLDGMRSLRDVAGFLRAVQTSYDGRRACSAVEDTTTGDRPWRTCDHALQRFSPAGGHLLAIPSDSDGLGPTSVSVLSSRTGDVVATYTVEDGFIGAQAWEDDEHVLLVRHLWATGAWDVVRVDLEGNVERAAGPVQGSEDDRPISLAGNS